MASHSVQLPPHFYRVQHDRSFTLYDRYNGFVSRGHYTTDYDNWVTAKMFHRHLDWRNRSPELSPFISVFDNQRDALDRAEDHRFKWGHRGVFVAQIDTQSLRPTVLVLAFEERPVHLPAREAPDISGVPIFVSTRDVRRYLGVQVGVSQVSEWFALDYIPGEMITRILTLEQDYGGDWVWVDHD